MRKSVPKQAVAGNNVVAFKHDATDGLLMIEVDMPLLTFGFEMHLEELRAPSFFSVVLNETFYHCSVILTILLGSTLSNLSFL